MYRITFSMELYYYQCSVVYGTFLSYEIARNVRYKYNFFCNLYNVFDLYKMFNFKTFLFKNMSVERMITRRYLVSMV